MLDLGESDARARVSASAEEQEGVFDRFRDRLEGLTKEHWEYILESSERQGANHVVCLR